jgi:hypothetical protein
MKYSGSDPSGIMDIHSEKTKNVSIFNLNGQQLMGPRKGINIIGGKKVVVK